MPARAPRSRQKSENPFAELIVALLASRAAGVRPGDPGAFEQFLASPAAGFIGPGTLKALRGVKGRVKEITLEGKAVPTSTRMVRPGANDPHLQGTRMRSGNEPPTNQELFDMALRAQRAPADARSFEEFMKKIRVIFDDLK